MKKTVSFLTFCLITIMTMGQTDVQLEYTKEHKAFLNGQELSNTTNLEDIKAILGEPTIYKEYPTGKTNYHYKEQGISIHMVNGNLLFIGINFNWDGDKTFPEKSFEGQVKIEDQTVDAKSNKDFLSNLKTVKILCLIPEMCMTNPKEIQNPIVVGFKDDLITQVGIEFH